MWYRLCGCNIGCVPVICVLCRLVCSPWNIWYVMCVYWYTMSHVSYLWVMSPIYESSLSSMSHVSYLWVMSPIYESSLSSMSQVSHLWVMSPIYESCLPSMSHFSHLWVIFPIYESCIPSTSHVSYSTCAAYVTYDLQYRLACNMVPHMGALLTKQPRSVGLFCQKIPTI
jgi:hypothetical protein